MPEHDLYLVDDETAIVESVTKWMKMHHVTVRSIASAEGQVIARLSMLNRHRRKSTS